MCTFMYNFTTLFHLRKQCTSLYFRKVQSSSVHLHNLARTQGMYMMPSKLAEKSVSNLSTKLAISSVGYIRQPSSLCIIMMCSILSVLILYLYLYLFISSVCVVLFISNSMQ